MLKSLHKAYGTYRGKLRNAWNRQAWVFYQVLQLTGCVDSEVIFSDLFLPLTNNLSYCLKILNRFLKIPHNIKQQLAVLLAKFRMLSSSKIPPG